MTAVMDVTGHWVNKPPKICKAMVGGRDTPCPTPYPTEAAVSVTVGLEGTGGCGNRSITPQREVSVLSKLSIRSVYCFDNWWWGGAQRPNKPCNEGEREREKENGAWAVACV